MNSEVANIHPVASLKLVSEFMTFIVLSVCLFIYLLCIISAFNYNTQVFIVQNFEQ